MDILRRAVAMGFRSADRYGSSRRWALRDRDDFRLFMMDLAMPAGRSPPDRGGLRHRRGRSTIHWAEHLAGGVVSGKTE